MNTSTESASIGVNFGNLVKKFPISTAAASQHQRISTAAPITPLYDFTMQALEMSLYGYLRQTDPTFVGHAISGIRSMMTSISNISNTSLKNSNSQSCQSPTLSTTSSSGDNNRNSKQYTNNSNSNNNNKGK